MNNSFDAELHYRIHRLTSRMGEDTAELQRMEAEREAKLARIARMDRIMGAVLFGCVFVCGMVLVTTADAGEVADEVARYRSDVAGVVTVVDQYRPQLDYIATAGDDVLNAECAGQVACVDTLKGQQLHLLKALQMLDQVTKGK